jgi:glyoxalase family protein
VVLTFPDPDGMKIEIVAHADAGEANAPRFASIPPEHAIRGFFGVTLLEKQANETAAILNVMGFEKIAEEGNRMCFAANSHALGNHIDLLIDPAAKFGRSGAGSVHHIAFRAKDDTAQKEWRVEISKHLDVTPVMDRTYFHSIYFREPGGALFELATDPPGFTLDEPIESLGEALRIRQRLESKRDFIKKLYFRSLYIRTFHLSNSRPSLVATNEPSLTSALGKVEATCKWSTRRAFPRSGS